MSVRRVAVIAGAVLLVAGVIGLVVPVSVSGNGESIGCGSGVRSDLSAARSADYKSGANVPLVNHVIPLTDYVFECESSLSTRQAWTIPLAVIGILTITGAFFLVGGGGTPVAEGRSPIVQ